jgi:glycosyltransferase involved in cell wall biosynthesis
MKIAIVAPSPVPFTVGGAEKLWWGLQQEINRNTPHQAELIKVPTVENRFWDLVASYERFWRLDLSYFDLVITGKYPAWMLRHDNHVCYMLHRLRGFYDCYHFLGLPDTYVTSFPAIVRLQRLLRSEEASDDHVERVFAKLGELRDQSDAPADAFAFPGSFIREIVRFFDNVALNPNRIIRYAAISKNVANRADYFPAGIEPLVVYPPPNLEGLHCGGSDYLFASSRLDHPKRIHLLVEAMRFVEDDLEVRIAGEGPEQSRLKELAAEDGRIKFLGYRSDVELVGDYADALAVVFCPYDEDYGLITVEAMLSGKPVVTTTDAGGPNEFVVDSETGFSVPPDPQQIGARIAWLARNREEAAALGRRAQSRVASITWSRAVEKLLPSQSSKRTARHRSRRRKFVVATTFPITPVRGGGQARIFNLYKNLFPNVTTEIVSVSYDQTGFDGEIAPGVREIRIVKTAEHAAAEAAISAQLGWVPVTDIVFDELVHLTPEYLDVLGRLAREADIVVASHPYTISTIGRVCADKPLWYEAQDVEAELKRSVLPDTAVARNRVDQVAEAERRCSQAAELILACSEIDARKLIDLYGIAPAKMRIVPNGIDTREVRFISRTESVWAKHRIGCHLPFVATFIGSWHLPNNEAAEFVLGVARHCPQTQFFILGSCSAAIGGSNRPANVALIGEASPDLKTAILQISDVALNPMRTGSGTNLKMLDYAASGIPILSSPHGARGLSFDPNSEIFVSDFENFVATLNEIQSTAASALSERTRRARQRVETEFDWRIIARDFLGGINGGA